MTRLARAALASLSLVLAACHDGPTGNAAPPVLLRSLWEDAPPTLEGMDAPLDAYVTDAEGVGVPGVRVRLEVGEWKLSGATVLTATAVTDANGHAYFTHRGLPSGVYSVWLRGAGLADGMNVRVVNDPFR